MKFRERKWHKKKRIGDLKEIASIATEIVKRGLALGHYCCDKKKKHDQEQLDEDRFPGNSSSLREIRAGTQGRNMEAETEADAIEKCLLLMACWTCFII